MTSPGLWAAALASLVRPFYRGLPVRDAARKLTSPGTASSTWSSALCGTSSMACRAGPRWMPACGTGRHAGYLVSLGHDVIGVDSSPEMLAVARAKVPGGDFREGDLRHLPVPVAAADPSRCRRCPAQVASRPVTEISNDELIGSAAAVLHPHAVDGRLFGDVGCTLATGTGRRYSGVCIDTGSGTGFCAEHAAIAAMVTAGEYRIAKIVAVWRDADGVLYVVPPCGRCREFIRQIDPGNLDTQVITSRNAVISLRELLPLNRWPDPLD